jgi:hypothetical protein
LREQSKLEARLLLARKAASQARWFAAPENRDYFQDPMNVARADWTLERIKRQAGEIGPNASALVEIIRVKGSRSAHRDTSRTERPKCLR